jgi:formate dehydrogenase iron-sulfur subunit
MMPGLAILTDTTKCIGCEACVTACKRINGLPESDPPPRSAGAPDALSATRWTAVVRRPGNRFVRKHCRHCLRPACVSACPVGALQRTPDGAVIYDPARCMGCRYCMLACPYGVPRYEWNALAPSVRKCILCHPHLISGRVKEPACVEACPTQASIFGPREALLAEARARLAADPGRYLPRVWGATEVGGTAVLYVADVPLGFLGWQDSRYLTDEPLPEKTWTALKWVPAEFLGVGVLMAGIHWVIQRRERLARCGEPAPDGRAGERP